SAQPASGGDETLLDSDRRLQGDAGLPLSDAAPESWREDTATSDRARREPTILRPGTTVESALPARRRNLMFSSTARKDREQAHSGGAEPSDHVGAPVPETEESPSASLQSRGLEPQRRTSRSPPGFAEVSTGPGAGDRPVPAQSKDQPAVTVIKSGLVDGMAYSLYSDGSIEAQMPEGMMRFASIDELRAHLDQRP
ncbi:MAG: hypothetical protein JO283_14080, partial [Bradyrhizobium sp.]|nr:hypothetical protein [Bradyrhizobium sp.]